MKKGEPITLRYVQVQEKKKTYSVRSGTYICVCAIFNIVIELDVLGWNAGKCVFGKLKNQKKQENILECYFLKTSFEICSTFFLPSTLI